MDAASFAAPRRPLTGRAATDGAAVSGHSGIGATAGSVAATGTRPADPTDQGPLRHRHGRHRRASAQRRVWLLRFLVVVAAVGAMKLVNVRSGDLVMPDPVDVVSAGRELSGSGTLWEALFESLKVLLIGFSLASGAGVTLGILFGGIPLLGRVAEPFVHALNSTPRVAFIPLIIVWLGLREEAKVAVIWLSAVVPIMVNTTAGIEAADADLTEMAKSFGANRRQLFWRVWIPGAIPTILTGLRIGASLAILGTVVSELYTAQAGLGGLLVRSSSRFRMDDYFAVVIVLMAVGIVITSALRWIERRFLVWRVTIAEGNGR